MTDAPSDDLDADERAALTAWQVPPPPTGFADRVLAAREQPAGAAAAVAAPPARSRWPRPGLVIAALIGVAAIALAIARSATPPPARGAVAAERRTTVALGTRGTAVAETGAALSWAVEAGVARLSQAQGAVFYRVEPGGPFTVETPSGRVEVTGTCFRVEVMTMKPNVQGIVGAAIGAALVVTVYEGSVLFAGKGGGEQRATAGERIVVEPGGAKVVDDRSGAPGEGDPALAAAPPADISREDLLVRDRVQRDEIAALRGRMQRLEATGGGGGGPALDGRDRDPSGRPWFDPTKEDLAGFVKDCRVRVDLPPIEGPPRPLGPEAIAELGLVAGEPEVMLAAGTAVVERYHTALRAIYIEVTGNQSGADELSAQAMASEIRDKSGESEDGRVRRMVARERAGQATPPRDLTGLSPYERYFRMMAGLGDELEREIGTKLGAERARAIRAKAGGWPMRMEIAGCDDAGSPGE